MRQKELIQELENKIRACDSALNSPSAQPHNQMKALGMKEAYQDSLEMLRGPKVSKWELFAAVGAAIVGYLLATVIYLTIKP